MGKPIATLAAAGLIGLVLAKLAGFLVFPVIGFLLGLLMLVLKVVLIAALIWLGYRLFTKLTERPSEG